MYSKHTSQLRLPPCLLIGDKPWPAGLTVSTSSITFYHPSKCILKSVPYLLAQMFPTGCQITSHNVHPVNQGQASYVTIGHIVLYQGFELQ